METVLTGMFPQRNVGNSSPSAINLCIDPNMQFLIDLILAGNGQYMTNKEHRISLLFITLHQ
jgi:hypothetical protein